MNNNSKDEVKLEALRKRVQIGRDQIVRGESHLLQNSNDIENFLDDIESEIDAKRKSLVSTDAIDFYV